MKIFSAGCIILFLILMNIQLYAQKYGLQGGVNFSDMVIKDKKGSYGLDKLAGFNIGITIDYEISKLTELEIGIIYESRGTEDDTKGFKMTYMNYPLLLKVGPTIGQVKIYGAAGLYFGVGLVGLYIYNENEEQYIWWFKWGKGKDALFRRLDYGAKFGIGLEVEHLNLGVFYSLGIANLSAVRSPGSKIQNSALSICAGYRF
jgi:hypothetical protein